MRSVRRSSPPVVAHLWHRRRARREHKRGHLVARVVVHDWQRVGWSGCGEQTVHVEHPGRYCGICDGIVAASQQDGPVKEAVEVRHDCSLAGRVWVRTGQRAGYQAGTLARPPGHKSTPVVCGGNEHSLLRPQAALDEVPGESLCRIEQLLVAVLFGGPLLAAVPHHAHAVALPASAGEKIHDVDGRTDGHDAMRLRWVSGGGWLVWAGGARSRSKHYGVLGGARYREEPTVDASLARGSWNVWSARGGTLPSRCGNDTLCSKRMVWLLRPHDDAQGPPEIKRPGRERVASVRAP